MASNESHFSRGKELSKEDWSALRSNPNVIDLTSRPMSANEKTPAEKHAEFKAKINEADKELNQKPDEVKSEPSQAVKPPEDIKKEAILKGQRTKKLNKKRKEINDLKEKISQNSGDKKESEAKITELEEEIVSIETGKTIKELHLADVREKFGINPEIQNAYKESRDAYVNSYRDFHKKNAIGRRLSKTFGGKHIDEMESLKVARDDARVRYASEMERSVRERLEAKGKDKEYIDKALAKYNGIVRFNELVRPDVEALQKARAESLGEKGLFAHEKALAWAAKKNQALESTFGKNGAKFVRAAITSAVVTTVAGFAGAFGAASLIGIAGFGAVRFGRTLASAFAGAAAAGFTGKIAERGALKTQAKAKEELVNTGRRSVLTYESLAALDEKRSSLLNAADDATVARKKARAQILTGILTGAGISGVVNFASADVLHSGAEIFGNENGGAYVPESAPTLESVDADSPNLELPQDLNTPPVSVSEVAAPTYHSTTGLDFRGDENSSSFEPRSEVGTVPGPEHAIGPQPEQTHGVSHPDDSSKHTEGKTGPKIKYDDPHDHIANYLNQYELEHDGNLPSHDEIEAYISQHPELSHHVAHSSAHHQTHTKPRHYSFKPKAAPTLENVDVSDPSLEIPPDNIVPNNLRYSGLTDMSFVADSNGHNALNLQLHEDAPPSVESPSTSYEPAAVKVGSGEGAIKTFEHLQQQLKTKGYTPSNSPEIVKHLLGTKAENLAKEFGFYKENQATHAFENAKLFPGDSIVFDKNGDLAFIHKDTHTILASGVKNAAKFTIENQFGGGFTQKVREIFGKLFGGSEQIIKAPEFVHVGSVDIDPSHATIVSDSKGLLTVYGGTEEKQFNFAQDYVKAHPGAQVVMDNDYAKTGIPGSTIISLDARGGIRAVPYVEAGKDVNIHPENFTKVVEVDKS